jgi:hypothetical protein
MVIQLTVSEEHIILVLNSLNVRDYLFHESKEDIYIKKVIPLLLFAPPPRDMY